jgi:PhzF family phenazine biosynthesis protein
MRIPIFHVDAFTHRPFHGNPAAICLLNSWLDDEHLRKVAAENNLSATAFLVQQKDRYDLRWFTPLREIRLCGHATLATAHLLFSALKTTGEVLSFETRFSGALTIRQEDGLIAMDFPCFQPKHCTNIPGVLRRALNAGEDPLEVWEANDCLIAVLSSATAVKSIRPDLALLQQLHPYVVAITAPGDNCDFVSRYFAPSYGVPEDPVTGSAHSALAPFWATRLSKTQLHARQVSTRGGELWCEIAGDRTIIRGNAVLTMNGTLEI